MTRTAATLLGLVVLAGCSVGSPAPAPDSSPAAATPSACTPLTAPAVPGDGAPTAILRDVAAGQREFLIGSPGGLVNRIIEATGASTPQMGGDRVFFSVGHGSTGQEIRAARVGECSVHFATGTMSALDTQGRAVVVSDAGKSRLLDAAGRAIADVTAPSGSWTADGHLAVPTAALGLKVYDLTGAVKDVNLPAGSVPSGPLGASGEMVSTPAGVQLLDLRDGHLQALPVPPTTQRLLSGSPDGNYVALVDGQGIPQVIRVRDGQTMQLPLPGPSLGALWDRSSRWVAVQSLYGGAAMRVADGKVVQMGPLNVVSW